MFEVFAGNHLSPIVKDVLELMNRSDLSVSHMAIPPSKVTIGDAIVLAKRLDCKWKRIVQVLQRLDPSISFKVYYIRIHRIMLHFKEKICTLNMKGIEQRSLAKFFESPILTSPFPIVSDRSVAPKVSDDKFDNIPRSTHSSFRLQKRGPKPKVHISQQSKRGSCLETATGRRE
jgi:hypothetical protein